MLALLLFSVVLIPSDGEEVDQNPTHATSPANPTTPTNPGTNNWIVDGITYTNMLTSTSATVQIGMAKVLLEDSRVTAAAVHRQPFSPSSKNTPATSPCAIDPFFSSGPSTDTVTISVSLGPRVWRSIANLGTVAVASTNDVVSATVVNRIPATALVSRAISPGTRNGK